jgi:hypothetical protein
MRENREILRFAQNDKNELGCEAKSVSKANKVIAANNISGAREFRGERV